MRNRYALSTYIDIAVACRVADVSPALVHRYMELGLVNTILTYDDLATLRRARRLRSLGVNLVGVEIILRMRRQIEELRSEVARLQAVTRDNIRG
jgi:DNA-binding transcriptional MerR regulator